MGSERRDRVLVVDDDPHICSLMGAVLAEDPVELVGAGSGEEALARVREGPEPDLVVLDWMMPGMGGLGFLSAFRELPGSDRVPVLLLTARSRSEDVAVGLDAGANDYLTKPFELVELRARIRAGLRVRHLFLELERARADHVQQERLKVLLETTGAIAHALNQPLTASLLRTERLLERVGPGEAIRGDLEFVRRSLERAAEALGRIRHLAVYRTTTYVEGVDILDLDGEDAE